MQSEPGAKSRVLIDGPENIELHQDWFPDGKSVLVVISKTMDPSQLTRVSVSDGT